MESQEKETVISRSETTNVYLLFQKKDGLSLPKVSYEGMGGGQKGNMYLARLIPIDLSTNWNILTAS